MSRLAELRRAAAWNRKATAKSCHQLEIHLQGGPSAVRYDKNSFTRSAN
jgi:hypothetical protein